MAHFLLTPQVRGAVPFNLACVVLDQRAGSSKSLFLVILSSFPLIVVFVISYSCKTVIQQKCFVAQCWHLRKHIYSLFSAAISI